MLPCSHARVQLIDDVERRGALLGKREGHVVDPCTQDTVVSARMQAPVRRAESGMHPAPICPSTHSVVVISIARQIFDKGRSIAYPVEDCCLRWTCEGWAPFHVCKPHTRTASCWMAHARHQASWLWPGRLVLQASVFAHHRSFWWQAELMCAAESGVKTRYGKYLRWLLTVVKRSSRERTSPPGVCSLTNNPGRKSRLANCREKNPHAAP